MSQKYFGCRIVNLLPRINHEILIPGIQRPYVWEPEQIVKLFDSLMRGYPINTFMFWHLEPSHFGDWEIYRFVRDFRQGDIHNDTATLVPGQAVTLVLDGQQRLTSLLIGLTGSYTVRNGLRGKGAAWVPKVLMHDLLQSPDVNEDDDDGTTIRPCTRSSLSWISSRPVATLSRNAFKGYCKTMCRVCPPARREPPQRGPWPARPADLRPSV